jgi:hypothetical protein
MLGGTIAGGFLCGFFRLVVIVLVDTVPILIVLMNRCALQAGDPADLSNRQKANVADLSRKCRSHQRQAAFAFFLIVEAEIVFDGFAMPGRDPARLDMLNRLTCTAQPTG